jgi:hypothetical protein
MRSLQLEKAAIAFGARESLLGHELGKALSVVHVAALQFNDGQTRAREFAITCRAALDLRRPKQPGLAVENRNGPFVARRIWNFVRRRLELRIQSRLDPSPEPGLETLEVGNAFLKAIDAAGDARLEEVNPPLPPLAPPHGMFNV